MFFLAYRSLRSRPARTLFTALAIALGVGMIFAMRLVAVTITESARAAREGRLAGADLEVTSAAGAHFSDSVAETLLMQPQVDAAAPIFRALEGASDTAPAGNLMAGAQLIGTGLALLGVDPARTLNRYELVAGQFFDSNPVGLEILLPTQWAALNGVGVGNKVSLTTGPSEQTHDYTVIGLLKSESGPVSQSIAWLSLATMQAVFDAPDAASAILVRLKPGVNKEATRDELQEALGSQFIVTSASGGGGLNSLFGLVNLALPFSGFVILLAGAFLVFNAFAITLAERKREIGQLRTLGMTRGQVLAQTLAEATLTALLGSIIGLLFGWVLGAGVTATIRALQGANSVPDSPFPWDGILLALSAGLLVTLAVTFNLAREAARVSPLEALRTETKNESKRGRMAQLLSSGGLAVVLIITALGLFFWAQQFSRDMLEPSYTPTFITLGVLSVGWLALLPVWVSGVIGVWERVAASRVFRSGGVLSGAGIVARLAAGSLAQNRARAALTAATLVIGLMIVIALSGIAIFFKDFLVVNNTALLDADFLLSRSFPAGVTFEQAAALPSLPPIPADLQTALDSLTDVAEVTYFANVSLPGIGVETSMGDQYAFAASLSIVKDNPVFPIAEGSWAEAEKIFAAGPALLLPELTARRLNKHPGDTIEIDTLKGKIAFTVALVGGGFPVITSEVGQEYFGSYPLFVRINAQPGVERAVLEDRVDELVSRHRAEVVKANPADLQNTVDNLAGPIVGLFSGLTSLSGIVAALGIVVTLFASVLERQRELGTLRALGMSRTQVRGMVLLEAGLLGFTGATLGALAGLTLAYVFGYLMRVSLESIAGPGPITQLPVPIPWEVAGAAIVLSPLIAMLAALWPADRAVNVNPADAMRAEGATGFLKPATHLGPTGLRGLLLRLPLSAKLSAAFGLIFILATATLTIVRVDYERRLLEDNIRALLENSGHQLVDFFREQLPTTVTELNAQTLAAIEQQASAQTELLQIRVGEGDYAFELKYFFVLDTQGNVVRTDHPEFLGRTLTQTIQLSGSSAVARLADWLGEPVFEAGIPIENQAGVRVGQAQIGLSREPVNQFIGEVVNASLATTAVAVLVTIVLTVWLTRRALSPVKHLAEASQAVARGDLTQRVPETQWDEVGQLARAFNEMVEGLNERERMRDLFGRYLSREVSEAVLAGRVTFKGERKTITVLYCDMRGSTTFAEQHAPEEVMTALNEYFEVVILAVEAQGGIVNRFVGDETVCVFGAPTEYRDHADRAVQAALGIRAGFAYLNEKRTRLGLPTLRFGIGINTGEVVAGATGSEERQEYTLIGDAMNVGARIEQLNKTFPDHDILLSEFTQTALGEKANAYALVDLGEVEVRGKSRLVRVWGVGATR